MSAIIGLLVVYLVAQMVLLGIAIAEGFLLHWLIPAVDLNTGILVGTAFSIASFYLFVTFLRFAADLPTEGEADEEGEEGEEEPPGVWVALPPLGRRGRRRKIRR